MNCPKCRNECPEGLLYCPVCYEVMSAKPPPLPPPERTEPPPLASVPSDGASASSRGFWSWIKITAALAAATGLFIRFRGPSPVVGRLPAVSLPSVSGGTVVVNTCPTPKCLMVYVAPWCPHCRAAEPLIRAVRDDLSGRGVTVRIVVGKDRPEAVAAYADIYGPDTLMDDGPSLEVPAVPAIFVSNTKGDILAETAGLPPIDPPADSASLRRIEKKYFLISGGS